MKLRNKKTGEIWGIPKGRMPVVQEGDISFWARKGSEGHLFSYKSIADLNEEWEDYAPTEPLIKDEKIRNLVREWTGLWETEDRWYVRDSGEILISRGDIELCLPLSYGIKEGHYTIAELCGEGEE